MIKSTGVSTKVFVELADIIKIVNSLQTKDAIRRINIKVHEQPRTPFDVFNFYLPHFARLSTIFERQRYLLIDN